MAESHKIREFEEECGLRVPLDLNQSKEKCKNGNIVAEKETCSFL